MTLLAGYGVLLHAVSGQTAVTVGTPVANREPAAVEALIGPFLNTLVLRLDIDPEASFRAFLERVRDVCVRGFDHGALPYDRLVKSYAGRQDLYRAWFVLQNNPMPEGEWAGITAIPEEIPVERTKCDLTLDLTETSEGISGMLEFATDLLTPATARGLAEALEGLLRTVAEDPDRSVAVLRRDLQATGEERTRTRRRGFLEAGRRSLGMPRRRPTPLHEFSHQSSNLELP
jgi:non-ribosomal peptide synthetase component F